MNQDRLRTYRQIGITAFFVIAASMLLAFFLFRTSSIGKGISRIIDVFNPIIYAFVIAYVLSPVVTLIEKLIYHVISRRKWTPAAKVKQTIRLFSALTAIILAVWLVYELIALIVPEMISSIRNIIRNIPMYQSNIDRFINHYFSSELIDKNTVNLLNDVTDQLQAWVNTNVTPQLDQLAGSVTSQIFNFVTFLKNIFLGLIVSLYILVSKEHFMARMHRFIYAFFKIPTANRILANVRFIDEKFGGFLIGKIIDSAIIGVICYVILKLMNMPYTMLISVVIGVTNVIPFFGPFLGALPATFLIFVVNPIQALYFIIFILILQQFDGNFLGPKILGSSVGVSSFMVVVAILIGGGFFGVFGMVIGVPLCAIVMAVIQGYEMRQMQKKHLPGDIESYRYVDKINPHTHEIFIEPKNRKTKSLYDAITYRGESIRRFDEPLQMHSWDRSIDDILEEDARMNGVAYRPSTSEYVIKDPSKKVENDKDGTEEKIKK